MVGPLSTLGLTLLINESVRIERGGDSVYPLGLDDINHFYTESGSQALHTARRIVTLPDGCSCTREKVERLRALVGRQVATASLAAVRSTIRRHAASAFIGVNSRQSTGCPVPGRIFVSLKKMEP